MHDVMVWDIPHLLFLKDLCHVNYPVDPKLTSPRALHSRSSSAGFRVLLMSSSISSKLHLEYVFRVPSAASKLRGAFAQVNFKSSEIIFIYGCDENPTLYGVASEP